MAYFPTLAMVTLPLLAQEPEAIEIEKRWNEDRKAKKVPKRKEVIGT